MTNFFVIEDVKDFEGVTLLSKHSALKIKNNKTNNKIL